ncbi:MAG: M13 family metallopeptidase, partial [Bacteroidales bacterium]|nr:M13 family metallopeptidase [Bacteroidales bacterium]
MKKTLIIMMSLLAFAACAPKSGAPALDLSNLDTTVSPKADFYQYATGGWQKNNPLKPEFSRYGSFDALREQAQENLNALFESMTTMQAAPGSVEQKISDLYKMALDSTTRNSLGAQPILPYIAEIQAIGSKDELATLLGKMNLYGEGGFYGFGVEADLTNSDMQVLYMSQGGLGMGDRDYYLKEENKALYEGYKAFLVKVLGLAGIQSPEKVADLDLVVENALAKIFWSREQNRDMQAIYNPMSTEEIVSRWPAIRFDLMCEAAGVAPQEKVIVAQPSYFDGLNEIFEKRNLEFMKAYLLCQFVAGQCSALDDEFYTASWEFFSHQMAGAQEQQPRWKRAMSVPNGILGEAVGEMYVSRYFPESSKKKMVTLVENLRTALGQHIAELEWMGDETKAKAQEKLAAFTVKIGYPDKWKDYSTLDINPENTYYENLRNASAWYVKDNLDKLGKPTDKTEWGMTPQTVNAYYNPTTNEICFPAAILQKPFFDPDADEPVNYGGIGVVIGHEMSHGFDDQGSMFDANGNMVNWWTEEDKAKFDALGDKLVEQFNQVEILPGVHANGRYTLGENIGDHGGLSIAFTAMENAVGSKKDPMIDGFTRAQRFYLSYGAIWAQNIRDEEKIRLTNLDVHSLAV